MAKLSRRERERQTRRKEMIDAAERLFCAKGVDNVSMDEIAKEAEFTKRTLYQYFVNKEDLFFAVALRSFERLTNYTNPILEEGKDGFDKMHRSVKAYYDFFKENPGHFNVINYIGRARQQNLEMPPMYEEMVKFNKAMFQEVAGFVVEGQNDGTIRTDWDPGMTAHSVLFLMTGFFNAVAHNGPSFTDYMQRDIEVKDRFDLDHFANFAINIVLNSLKGDKPSAAQL